MVDVQLFLDAFGEQFAPSFAGDVLKALIGTLIGAGAAFSFALRKDDLTRKNEHRSAGNMAMTTLARMISDFVQVKAAILDTKAEILKAEPDAPLWMLVKPTPFTHAAHLHFDTEALTFIFDYKQGPDVFNALANAELKYHSFFDLLAEHKKVASEAQDVLAVAHPDAEQPKQVREYVKALGFARWKRLESLNRALLAHVERDEDAYKAAHDQLQAFLKSTFKRKRVLRFGMPTEEDRRTSAL